MNRHFTKENIQLVNYVHEKMFNILAIRQMQIKTTTIRMAQIKTSDNTKKAEKMDCTCIIAGGNIKW